MAIDRMDWHYGGDYPKDLPPECGCTHIGLFLAWIIHNQLESEFHKEDSAEELEAVRQRKMTGREFLINQCDEKFWDEDLNEEGLAFTQSYYDDDTHGYLCDYANTLAQDLPSLYYVEDTWENYDRIEPLITAACLKWKTKADQ